MADHKAQQKDLNQQVTSFYESLTKDQQKNMPDPREPEIHGPGRGHGAMRSAAEVRRHKDIKKHEQWVADSNRFEGSLTGEQSRKWHEIKDALKADDKLDFDKPSSSKHAADPAGAAPPSAPSSSSGPPPAPVAIGSNMSPTTMTFDLNDPKAVTALGLQNGGTIKNMRMDGNGNLSPRGPMGLDDMNKLKVFGGSVVGVNVYKDDKGKAVAYGFHNVKNAEQTVFVAADSLPPETRAAIEAAADKGPAFKAEPAQAAPASAAVTGQPQFKDARTFQVMAPLRLSATGPAVILGAGNDLVDEAFAKTFPKSMEKEGGRAITYSFDLQTQRNSKLALAVDGVIAKPDLIAKSLENALVEIKKANGAFSETDRAVVAALEKHLTKLGYTSNDPNMSAIKNVARQLNGEAPVAAPPSAAPVTPVAAAPAAPSSIAPAANTPPKVTAPEGAPAGKPVPTPPGGTHPAVDPVLPQADANAKLKVEPNKFEFAMQEPDKYTVIPEVIQAQQLMLNLKKLDPALEINLGSPKPDDGKHGPLTRDSVIAAQHYMGLPADGKITDKFITKLKETIANPTYALNVTDKAPVLAAAEILPQKKSEIQVVATNHNGLDNVVHTVANIREKLLATEAGKQILDKAGLKNGFDSLTPGEKKLVFDAAGGETAFAALATNYMNELNNVIFGGSPGVREIFTPVKSAARFDDLVSRPTDPGYGMSAKEVHDKWVADEKAATNPHNQAGSRMELLSGQVNYSKLVNLQGNAPDIMTGMKDALGHETAARLEVLHDKNPMVNTDAKVYGQGVDMGLSNTAKLSV